MPKTRDNSARLLITCPDRPGIVAAVSGFLYSHGVNVITMSEYATPETEDEGGTFFMRCEYETPYMDIERPAIEQSFAEVVAERFEMSWRFAYADEPKRMAIFVSRADHALMELLWRWSRGELAGEVAVVISNHEAARAAVEGFGVPFHHVPATPETRAEAEARFGELMGESIDLVVLARYMQILSPQFVARYPARIINIHHSFLPAFVGANPYRQAHERGVKVIGATAHYVTADLDEGPIIEQDVARVTHRDDVKDLAFIGRDLERQVLARAVRWHLQDRIIVHGNRTVVFS